MSTVIKAGQSGPILMQLSAVDLADHLAEAQVVVDQARRRAARVLEDAKREAERLHEDARSTGHEAGYQQGYREGIEAGQREAHEEAMKRFSEQHEHLAEDFRRAVGAIDSMKNDLQIRAERDVLDFAIDLAGRLTFAIGLAHHESAVENLRRALRIVGDQSKVSVHVHPADMEAMRDFASGVLDRASGSPAIELIPDDSVAPGGCDVRSAETHVDATLNTQIDEMVSCLVGAADGDD